MPRWALQAEVCCVNSVVSEVFRRLFKEGMNVVVIIHYFMGDHLNQLY